MHTVVLNRQIELYTDASGFVKNEHILPPAPAIRISPYDRFLGGWYPYYEVWLRGKVYRRLAKRREGQIRCVAPGLRSDGTVLALGEGVPNTPAALIHEIAVLSDLSIAIVNEEAFDLLALASDRDWRYGVSKPTEIPEKYRFKNGLLTTVDADGKIKSLYDVPEGRDVKSWRVAVAVIRTAKDAVIDEFVSDAGNVRLVGELAYLQLAKLAKAVRPEAIRHSATGTYRFAEELTRIGTQMGEHSRAVGLYKEW